MIRAEVLVIGAGAAGLAAAYELVKTGKQVTILDARGRIGGRILTFNDLPYSANTELGAEFVHGNLPVTLQLLAEANIKTIDTTATMWQYNNGRFEKNDQFIEGWDTLMAKLNQLENDIPIRQFLNEEFAGDKFIPLRKSVEAFVSGYDTADPEIASSFSLRKEWQSEDDSAQHRIQGGYIALLNFMAEQCKTNRGKIVLNAVAKEINWKRGEVLVETESGDVFQAPILVIAMPLGVLQLTNGQGAVTFTPEIEHQRRAILQLGFGAVIKFLFWFDEIFWEDDPSKPKPNNRLKEMGYLFSDECIPTWWTQYPAHQPLLTGWIGGPDAANRKNSTEEELLKEGLTSLSNIYNIDVHDLRKKITAWKIINWTTEPFSWGSYAYDTVDSQAARKVLSVPIEDTIYFAGDAFYEGTAMGTVEAALASGLDAAKKIVSTSK